MSGSDSGAPGRIFISYRREETAYPAGWLFDRLTDHFGTDQVFKDVDSIDLGDDFVSVITAAVTSCDVLLALIGDRWVTITDDEGRRRLDNPEDFVRLEIQAALAREVRVIPILVDGARMPRSDEVPSSLGKLVRRQALELSPSRFEFDTNRLLTVLKKTLGDAAGPLSAASEATGSAGFEGSTMTAAERTDQLGGDAPTGSPSGPSTRIRVLVGVGAAIAVVVLLVAALLAISGGGRSGNIFSDDFSTRAGGWQATGNGGGAYGDGSYRIHGDPAGSGGNVQSSPVTAAGIYPTAPTAVRIDVDARRISAPAQGVTFAVLCRVREGNAYFFSISDDHVSIEKYTVEPPYYEQLKSGPLTVDTSATTRMRGVCTGDAHQQHLRFVLNGTAVLDVTDLDHPLSTGSVGLGVATGGSEPVDAEFDNFVVRKS